MNEQFHIWISHVTRGNINSLPAGPHLGHHQRSWPPHNSNSQRYSVGAWRAPHDSSTLQIQTHTLMSLRPSTYTTVMNIIFFHKYIYTWLRRAPWLINTPNSHSHTDESTTVNLYNRKEHHCVHPYIYTWLTRAPVTHRHFKSKRMQSAVWCNVLQFFAVWCRHFKSKRMQSAVWCNVLQCDAVCCSVLQCAAVCCSGSYWHFRF